MLPGGRVHVSLSLPEGSSLKKPLAESPALYLRTSSSTLSLTGCRVKLKLGNIVFFWMCIYSSCCVLSLFSLCVLLNFFGLFGSFTDFRFWVCFLGETCEWWQFHTWTLQSLLFIKIIQSTVSWIALSSQSWNCICASQFATHSPPLSLTLSLLPLRPSLFCTGVLLLPFLLCIYQNRWKQ